MLCKVQVIKHAAHYCVFAHSCLVNYRNIKTTTLNFEMFLFRMFFKHYCKVELEAKFGVKFFSRSGNFAARQASFRLPLILRHWFRKHLSGFFFCLRHFIRFYTSATCTFLTTTV